MAASPSKAIYISYADEDRAVAFELKDALKDLFEFDAWLRDFDLNGGDLFVEAIHEALEEAKWLIILLSSSSIKSRWIQMEANVATMRAIQDLNVKIIVAQLDATPLPKHLDTIIKDDSVIDLSKSDDRITEFIKIAEYIQKRSDINTTNDIYVDRGKSTDDFALVARTNIIIFIIGLAGIGKTAFVLKSVPQWLKKRPFTIRISRGHSLDLLCRQILQKAHEPQPIGGAAIQDRHLLRYAIDVLKKRGDKFFLFLDNVEEGLDGSNQLLPYLETFLEAFQSERVDTHCILATTRIVEYSATIGKDAQILRLNKLEDKYIKDDIDQLLLGSDRHDTIMKMPELDRLIELVSGHPLAAKLLASFLRVKSPEQLLSENERQRFELNLAQYILKTTDQRILTDLHRLILGILATVGEPMLMEDILAVRELKRFKLVDIQQARWDLANLFIIDQHGELLVIHNFMGTYFRNQLGESEKLRDSIANDVGLYAHNKAMELNNTLKFLTAEDRHTKADHDEISQVSNSLLRYAVPAAKLLRAVGKDDLADELPIQIQGTIREMVFYFYQEKRDYEKARFYAEKWLSIDPNDSEIILQLARCYRNFRDSKSLDKAEKLLNDLSSRAHGKYFTARLYRERALVAQQKGDTSQAKNLFRAGIRIDTAYPYIENYVGLSKIILGEAEGFPAYTTRHQELAKQAVNLLEQARTDAVAFDRYHIGDYVEALIEVGEEGKALPLLKEALQDRPNDDRLNYRMAEILRKREDYDNAERYAKIAHRQGHRKAALALANIYYGQAMRALHQTNNILFLDRLQEGLNSIKLFKPEYGDDQEIADTIAAKIHRTMGNLPEAERLLNKYPDTENPYTIYEQCKTDIGKASQSSAAGNTGIALNHIQKVTSRIKAHSINHELHPSLREIFEEAEGTRTRLESI